MANVEAENKKGAMIAYLDNSKVLSFSDTIAKSILF